jgi:TetR/AcrR family transcriptional regulator, cholesterol catabolism regulator
MKMEDLSRESGFNKQSIYAYIRAGLLPKPTKIGFRQVSYNDGYVQLLKRIRRLRDEEGLSLTEIKELLDVEKPIENGLKTTPEVRKEQIIDAAIPLFSKNGFENTAISDIMDALNVSKATFYLYFKSKRDLFIECIGRLTMIIIPQESWEQVRGERDFVERQRIKLSVFLKEFPTFNGILNLVRLSLKSHDPDIAKKARDTYKILTHDLEKDLRRAIKDGVAREVNADLTSFSLLGMAEGLGHRLLIDSQYTLEEAVEVLLDVLRRTYLLAGNEEAEGNFRASRWAVKDSTGFTVQLGNIRFDGTAQLSGVIGEGKLALDMAKVSSIRIRRNGVPCVATVATLDGKEIILTVDNGMISSGDSDHGKYEIPVEKVSEIRLIPEDEIGS